MTDFVSSIEKLPIQNSDPYLQKLSQDETYRKKNKYMGNESMMYSLRTERERIEENQQLNSYDTDPPEENPLRLRSQDKSKEIVPPLRYTFRGDMERIYDGLNNKGYPSIQNKITAKDFDTKMKKFKKNFRNHLNNKKTSEKQFLSPKKVFEDLHRKTHFKAAYALYLNYNSCLQDEAAKEMRKEEDRLEEMRYLSHKLSPRMSHATFTPNRLEKVKIEYPSPKKPVKIKKSNNDKLQRTYEDFELETDDSVVKVEKVPKALKELKTQRNSCDSFGKRKFIKSLSSGGGQNLEDELFQTQELLKLSQNGGNVTSFSRMSQFRTLKNKTKSALEKNNFLRRKHFKGNTLHKGEGRLFMTNGLTNSMFDSAIVKQG